MSLANVLAGLNVGTAVLAIIFAGAFLASVGFVSWAVDMVATWFESPDSVGEGTDDHTAMLNDQGRRDASEAVCDACGTLLAGDELVRALNLGECPNCGEEP